MANQIITATSILVHGRGSLALPYKVKNSEGTQIDISAKPLVFEVDGVPISTNLIADPSDPKGLLIQLTRTQVALLKTAPTRFTVTDNSRLSDGLPVVLWEGTIGRTGYVGEPDMVDG